MKYGISGYHRIDCKTYKTLVDMGCDKNDIIICVNDKNDLREYSSIYDNVVYVEGNCVAVNRNHLLEISNGEIILLDDDIRCFKKLVKKDIKTGATFEKIERIEELEKIIHECFDKMRQVGADTFGVYSMENAGFALDAIKRNGKYSLNKLYQGGFCGFIGGKKYYDEAFKVLDDYELILRLIMQKKRSIRRNDIIASKNGMGKDKGGYYDLYKKGIQQIYGKELVKRYSVILKSNDDYTRFRLK